RKATRQPPPSFEVANDPIGTLALRYSHPGWLAERFVEDLGADGAASLMAANNEAAPTAIRLNLSKGPRADILERLKADGIAIEREGQHPETVIVAGSPHLDAPSYANGLFHLQSEASQMVARKLAPAPGTTVIDCAAAPGGKTTHLAELAGENGRV